MIPGGSRSMSGARNGRARSSDRPPCSRPARAHRLTGSAAL
jgi:hypothetical protein